MIPSLSTATTWLNSAPIGPEQLRGKVVLVDFWTYTCTTGDARSRTFGPGSSGMGSRACC